MTPDVRFRNEQTSSVGRMINRVKVIPSGSVDCFSFISCLLAQTTYHLVTVTCMDLLGSVKIESKQKKVFKKRYLIEQDNAILSV